MDGVNSAKLYLTIFFISARDYDSFKNYRIYHNGAVSTGQHKITQNR